MDLRFSPFLMKLRFRHFLATSHHIEPCSLNCICNNLGRPAYARGSCQSSAGRIDYGSAREMIQPGPAGSPFRVYYIWLSQPFFCSLSTLDIMTSQTDAISHVVNKVWGPVFVTQPAKSATSAFSKYFRKANFGFVRRWRGRAYHGNYGWRDAFQKSPIFFVISLLFLQNRGPCGDC